LSVGAAAEQTAMIVSQERATARRWWHDRGLVGLLILFVLMAPLVTRRIYASDEIKYYAYTHSLFFDGDLDFSNDYLHWYQVDPVKFEAIYTDLYRTREPTGLPTNEAPIGTGLLWLPSYALAHVLTLGANSIGADVPADGWSWPYITAVCLTSYLLGCLGLLLCFAVARSYFGGRLSAVAVAAIWLSTPLIFYTVIAPPWSHATSLFAVSLFLWYWHRTRRPEGRTFVEWALLGAAGGLMMLIREQDVLFLVIPGIEVLVRLWSLWRERAATWRVQAGRLVLGAVIMGTAAFIVFIPQLIAYRVLTGQFGPSKVVQGKFNFTSPNFLNVLFNPEHGMIPWTPVIAFALLGMLLFWRRDRLFAGALLVSFVLQVYIAGSFLTWQSASSFGQRRFINSTMIFVLGAAALIAWALANGAPKWLVGGVIALFIAWNGGLLMQYALWCSPERQGLDWARVLKGQLELPGKAFGLIRDFLFDRERFYRSTRTCT
jgi:hypothetical protein